MKQIKRMQVLVAALGVAAAGAPLSGVAAEGASPERAAGRPIAASREAVLAKGFTIDLKVDPAETFSFFRVWRVLPGGGRVAGLVYYPHPETKPRHFQPDDMLELLFPKMDDVAYGATLALEVDDGEIAVGADADSGAAR